MLYHKTRIVFSGFLSFIGKHIFHIIIITLLIANFLRIETLNKEVSFIHSEIKYNPFPNPIPTLSSRINDIDDKLSDVVNEVQEIRSISLNSQGQSEIFDLRPLAKKIDAQSKTWINPTKQYSQIQIKKTDWSKIINKYK